MTVLQEPKRVKSDGLAHDFSHVRGYGWADRSCRMPGTSCTRRDAKTYHPPSMTCARRCRRSTTKVSSDPARAMPSPPQWNTNGIGRA
jgi:hypothetical protein